MNNLANRQAAFNSLCSAEAESVVSEVRINRRGKRSAFFFLVMAALLSATPSSFAQTGFYRLLFSSNQTPEVRQYPAATGATALSEQLCAHDRATAVAAIQGVAAQLGAPQITSSIKIDSSPTIFQSGASGMNGVTFFYYTGKCDTTLISQDSHLSFNTLTTEFRARNGNIDDCNQASDSMRLTKGYLNGEVRGPYYRGFSRYCSAVGNFVTFAP